jgi:hypothetical protein
MFVLLSLIDRAVDHPMSEKPDPPNPFRKTNIQTSKNQQTAIKQH